MTTSSARNMVRNSVNRNRGQASINRIIEPFAPDTKLGKVLVRLTSVALVIVGVAAIWNMSTGAASFAKDGNILPMMLIIGLDVSIFFLSFFFLMNSMIFPWRFKRKK